MNRPLSSMVLAVCCMGCLNGAGVVEDLNQTTGVNALGVETIAQLDGTVVGYDNNPVDEVVLTLSTPFWDFSKCWGYNQTAVTDSSGAYKFIDVKAPCSYELTVSKGGFSPVRPITYHNIIVDTDTSQLPTIGLAPPGSLETDLQGSFYFDPANEKALENLAISLTTTGFACPRMEYMVSKLTKTNETSWGRMKYLYSFNDVLAPCNYRLKFNLPGSEIAINTPYDSQTRINTDIQAGQKELSFNIFLNYPPSNISVGDFFSSLPSLLFNALIASGVTVTDLPADTSSVYFKYASSTMSLQCDGNINNDSVRLYFPTIQQDYYDFFDTDAFYLYVETEKDKKVYTVDSSTGFTILAVRSLSELQEAGLYQGFKLDIAFKDGEQPLPIQGAKFKLSIPQTQGNCIQGTWEGESDENGKVFIENAPWPCFYKVDSQQYPDSYQESYSGKLGKYLFVDSDSIGITLIPEEGAFTTSVQGWVFEGR